MPLSPPVVRVQQGPPPWGPAPPPGGGYGVPPGQGGPPPPRPKPITGSPETMALHAMTIDPRTGLPRGEKPPASTAAVLSLVCGILLCLGPITGITAIVAGVMARARARERPAEVGGAGMAAFGIALGIFNLVLSGLGFVYLVLSMMSG